MRVAPADPAVERVLRAEAEVFARYGIRVEVGWTGTDQVAPLRYVEAGSGRPILLLHGLGVFSAHWAPLMAQLPRRRSVALDLPGASVSGAPDDMFSDLRGCVARSLAEFVHAFQL